MPFLGGGAVIRRLQEGARPLVESSIVSTASVDIPFKPFLTLLKRISGAPRDWEKDHATSKELRKLLSSAMGYFMRELQMLPVVAADEIPKAEDIVTFWTRTGGYFEPKFFSGKRGESGAARRAKNAAAEIHEIWQNISGALWGLKSRAETFKKGEDLQGIYGHIESLLRTEGPRLTREYIASMYKPNTVLGSAYVLPPHGVDDYARELAVGRLRLSLGREPSSGEIEADAVLWYMRTYVQLSTDRPDRDMTELVRVIKERVSAMIRALKDVIISKAEAFGAVDDPVDLKADTTRLLGREPKRGEVAAFVKSVSRGGNVAGFNVINEIGLQGNDWEAFCEGCADANALLSRKGFGFLVPMTKIIVGHRPQDKILIKATGAYSSVGGHYFHEDGSIRIYYDDQFDRLTHDGVTRILLHEIGHLYYFRGLPVTAQARQNTLFDMATEFVSTYAQQDPAEDFAENFIAIIGRQYRLPNHTYTLSKDAFQRFKSVVALDPKAKSLNLRAENVKGGTMRNATARKG